ncbi:MAG TPA: transcriptional repressor [Synergistales bacterium]|nr:transcriptional repressor [Synergistales bacterium]
MENACQAAKILKSIGARVTPARVLMLETLHSGCGLFTAQALHEDLPEGTADLATVYRFLALLVEKNLAREVTGTDGVLYYEMACSHNPSHPHFECRSCGRIYCLEGYLPEEWKHFPACPQGHGVESVSVVFRGTCSNCLGKLEKEAKE